MPGDSDTNSDFLLTDSDGVLSRYNTVPVGKKIHRIEEKAECESKIEGMEFLVVENLVLGL